MKRLLLWICCGIPATAFFVAAFGKLKDPAGFFEAIRVYRLIDGPLIAWAVWLLISLEIAGGCALLVRPLRKGAILVFAPLLVLFTLAGISAKLRGIEIPCGCFGTLEQAAPFGWTSVLRNLALVGLLSGAWFLDTSTQHTDSDPSFIDTVDADAKLSSKAKESRVSDLVRSGI